MIRIRDEIESDIGLIARVTAAAFESLELSRHTEEYVIEALRAANALTISLVAELEGDVVGHIAFSPVSISDGTQHWYGLGPVSVLPQHQRKGIGTALIQNGLARLKNLGALGCCLVGHPEYYTKLGFERPSALHVAGVPSEVFFTLTFAGVTPKGEVTFHPGFTADGG